MMMDFCESDETCLYTPNIDAYQGHGYLISAGTFTDETLSGIELMRFASNEGLHDKKDQHKYSGMNGILVL